MISQWGNKQKNSKEKKYNSNEDLIFFASKKSIINSQFQLSNEVWLKKAPQLHLFFSKCLTGQDARRVGNKYTIFHYSNLTRGTGSNAPSLHNPGPEDQNYYTEDDQSPSNPSLPLSKILHFIPIQGTLYGSPPCLHLHYPAYQLRSSSEDLLSVFSRGEVGGKRRKDFHHLLNALPCETHLIPTLPTKIKHCFCPIL